MACLVNLRTHPDGLGGADPSGIWNWNGPSGTTFIVDGGSVTLNNGDVVGTNDDPVVDLHSFDLPLPYTQSDAFIYSGGEGSCADSQVVGLQLVRKPCAGLDNTIQVCINDPVFNLKDRISDDPTCTELDTGDWQNPLPNATPFGLTNDDDSTNDTFDPSLANVGDSPYSIELFQGQPIPDPSCVGDCDESTATLTIEVLDFDFDLAGEACEYCMAFQSTDEVAQPNIANASVGVCDYQATLEYEICVTNDCGKPEPPCLPQSCQLTGLHTRVQLFIDSSKDICIEQVFVVEHPGGGTFPGGVSHCVGPSYPANNATTLAAALDIAMSSIIGAGEYQIEVDDSGAFWELNIWTKVRHQCPGHRGFQKGAVGLTWHEEVGGVPQPTQDVLATIGIANADSFPDILGNCNDVKFVDAPCGQLSRGISFPSPNSIYDLGASDFDNIVLQTTDVTILLDAGGSECCCEIELEVSNITGCTLTEEITWTVVSGSATISGTGLIVTVTGSGAVTIQATVGCGTCEVNKTIDLEFDDCAIVAT